MLRIFKSAKARRKCKTICIAQHAWQLSLVHTDLINLGRVPNITQLLHCIPVHAEKYLLFTTVKSPVFTDAQFSMAVLFALPLTVCLSNAGKVKQAYKPDNHCDDKRAVSKIRWCYRILAKNLSVSHHNVKTHILFKTPHFLPCVLGSTLLRSTRDPQNLLPQCKVLQVTLFQKEVQCKKIP